MEKNKRRIILTGGGTAGHVTPHLALIPKLLEKGYEIHYIGTQDGIEKRMMAEHPEVTYHAVHSGKLRRYFDLKNFSDPFRVLKGAMESVRLIRTLKPDVCFSKGGFVAVPVVYGASRAKVPILCHESDLTPGLANKISARFADRIATTFPECAKALGDKAVCTGTPMRPELFTGNRQKGLAMCGFDGRKPVLMMMGGSLGAQSVNTALRAALPKLLPEMDIIHMTGKGNLDAALEGTPGYRQFEFMTDGLNDLLACADLILSRAGSNAICEFQALKKPMLLVPYPKGASRGDQILNAQSFEKRGIARVLLQENMTPDSLAEAIFALRADAALLKNALEREQDADGTQKILDLIEEIQT